MKYLLLPAVLAVFGRIAAATLSLPAPDEAYFAPDRTAVIRLEAREIEAGGRLHYTVTDFEDKEVTAEDAAVPDDRIVRIKLRLPAGYYELTFAEQSQTFGLFVKAPLTRPPDEFFGIDAGFSWFPGGAAEMSMMAALKRCGIAVVRERLSWREIAEDANPDTWAAGQGKRYLSVRERLGANGLKVLDVFHDAPAASGADPDVRSAERFPKDMLYLNTAWLGLFPRLAPWLFAQEAWNEPDDQLGPAAAYVPLVKALAWTRNESGVAVPIVGGIFSELTSDAFREGCAANRMLQVVDAVSYHTYTDALNMERAVGWYRDYFARYGREALPLYITESGWPWSADSARNIVMKAVEAKACGVRHIDPFFAQCYKEGALDFSMLRDNRSPLRAMAAYGQLAHTLSGFEYVGDLKHRNPEIVRARVFRGGDTFVAVLLMDQPGRKLDGIYVSVVAAEGIDGRSLPWTGPGKFAVPDGMAYLYLDPRAMANDFARLVDTDTTAMALYRRSRGPLPPAELSPVILQPRIAMDEVDCGQRRQAGFFVAAGAEADFTLTVNMFNLADTPVTVTPRLQLPDGIGVRPEKSPPPVTLAGKAAVDLIWHLDLRDYLAGHRGVDVVVEAGGPEGKLLDRISVPLLSVTRERPVYSVRVWNGNTYLPEEADWQTVPAIALSRNGGTSGSSEDFSVDARFLWDGKGLYFHCRVTDLAFVQEMPPEDAWRQDSLILAIDPGNSMRNDMTQYEYGISNFRGRGRWYPALTGRKGAMAMHPDSILRIRRDDRARQTWYEGRLAWADMAYFPVPLQDNVFGFDFCVTNSNGGQEHEALEWTPGIAAGGRDSALFGLFRLTAE